MSFTIPDNGEALHNVQSTIMQSDIDAIVGGIGSHGVIYGCQVQPQGVPDMSVQVSAGVVQIDRTRAVVSSGTVNIDVASPTLARLDLIVSNNTGTLSAIKGSFSAYPKAEPIPANSVLLAIVFIPPTTMSLTSSYIVDKRLFVAPLEVAAVGEISGAQSIPDNTPTVVLFDAEGEDTDSFHDVSTDNSRMTIPTGFGGLYEVGALVEWASNNSGVRTIQVRKGGTDVLTRDTRNAAGTSDQSTSKIVRLNDGEYVELVVFQDSGGPLNANQTLTSLWVKKVN